MVCTFFLEILPQLTVSETCLSHSIYLTFLIGFIFIHVLEKLFYQRAAGKSMHARGNYDLDPLPFSIMIDPRFYLDYVFLLLIFIPVVSYFFNSKSLIKDQPKKTIFQLKNRVFVTMQGGCIAYLIGVLFQERKPQQADQSFMVG